MLDHLRDGSVDIGIAFEAKNYEDIECERILKGNFVVLGSDEFNFNKKRTFIERSRINSLCWH